MNLRSWVPILVFPAIAAAQGGDVVFRSDVSLVRVDAQVLDRNHRAISGLHAEDFVLREEGHEQKIRNFGAENMPIDVLLLIDISASMRPHVQRLASAAEGALQVLGPDDRVGLMLFDRGTKLRLPFRTGRADISRELRAVIDNERFNGGTDINRGLFDAIKYVSRNARPEARRAIVIMTDDQTEFDRNEAAVESALVRADTVLSLLLAPDAIRRGGYPGGGGGGGGYPGGGYPGGGRRRGGGYPGGGYPGGGWPWPGGGGRGGVILGPGGGGGRGPVNYPRTQSAGTAEIARESGGDSMSVDDAEALETTLSRLRQRYALHFYLPATAKAGQVRSLDVDLSAAARRRYGDADVRFRRTYVAPDGATGAPPPGEEPVQVTRAGESEPATSAPSGSVSVPNRNQEGTDPEARPRLRRRPAVNERGGGGGPIGPQGGWPSADGRTEQPSPAATTPPPPPAQPEPDKGGWRKATPDDVKTAERDK